MGRRGKGRKHTAEMATRGAIAQLHDGQWLSRRRLGPGRSVDSGSLHGAVQRTAQSAAGAATLEARRQAPRPPVEPRR